MAITKLKIAIDASGLKQIFIAKKIGIDATLLSRYVRGDRELDDDTARKISKVLKVPQWQIRD